MRSPIERSGIRLRRAVDSGHLPAVLAAGVSQLVGRLPDCADPNLRRRWSTAMPKQNNFLSSADGAVIVDAAPYFGHPEVHLALLDYFQPMPRGVFDAYREARPVDAGFAGRREPWRLFGYLAVITVDGHSAFGRPFLTHLADALALYR